MLYVCKDEDGLPRRGADLQGFRKALPEEEGKQTLQERWSAGCEEEKKTMTGTIVGERSSLQLLVIIPTV